MVGSIQLRHWCVLWHGYQCKQRSSPIWIDQIHLGDPKWVQWVRQLSMKGVSNHYWKQERLNQTSWSDICWCWIVQIHIAWAYFSMFESWRADMLKPMEILFSKQKLCSLSSSDFCHCCMWIKIMRLARIKSVWQVCRISLKVSNKWWFVVAWLLAMTWAMTFIGFDYVRIYDCTLDGDWDLAKAVKTDKSVWIC